MLKRVADYDPYSQGIPLHRKMVDLETKALHPRGVKYVTQKEFDDMQTELREKIEEQTAVLLRVLIELRQSTLHLASMSDEPISEDDVEVDN